MEGDEMHMVRWDPITTLRQFDRLFEVSPTSESSTWLPRIDVAEGDGAIVVRAETAGVRPRTST